MLRRASRQANDRGKGGPLTLASDEALVRACGTGDLSAADALFDRFHKTVYRFLERFPGANSLPLEDIVQLTFLAAPLAATRFRGRSSVTSWLLGIAANLARQELRGERRRAEKHAFYAQRQLTIPELPDEWAERRECLRQVESALASLSPGEQIAFRRCQLEEVSGVDVARKAGVPPGTVWRRLHSARKAIRESVNRTD